MYDWYGEQTAGFFGVHNALEPLHVQLNLLDNYINIVNGLLHPLSNITLIATQYILSTEGKLSQPISVCNVQLNTVRESSVTTSPCKIHSDSYPISFVGLQLLNGTQMLSDNFYWLSSVPEAPDAYTRLNSLNPCVVDISVISCEQSVIQIHIANQNSYEDGTLAFFLRLQVLNATEDRILPVHYSDNYFSLLPQQSKIISISFQTSENWMIQLSGWNVQPLKLLSSACT